MNSGENFRDPTPDGAEVGDRNVERLLADSYQPEVPDPEFARRLVDTMCRAAAERAATPAVPDSGQATTANSGNARRRLVAAMAAAVLLAGSSLLLSVPQPQPAARQRAARQAGSQPGSGSRSAPAPDPIGLVARPLGQPPREKTLAVGERAQTEGGQKERLRLPDGSALYLNRDTAVRLVADREVRLEKGEAYVEVAPATDSEGHGEPVPFVVRTPARTVTALGTRFDVTAGTAGTGVVVTQGKVRLSGSRAVLHAGEQLAPGDDKPAPAPRASYLLDWARELVGSAEAAVVPASKFAGGALVARDATGQENRLSLRRYHIDVHIEDGFARTTIDQTYFNPDAVRLEGTFYFPLPPDASLSRLAMYVDGNRMEGGMAERDHARNVFEEIVTRQKDPALLEWVDGSTFKMRVFPLEPRQEKRIILSYTQRLPVLYGRTTYRFPGGHSMDRVRDWSFHARVKGGKDLRWDGDGRALKATKDQADLLLDAAAKDVAPDRDVVVRLNEADPAGGEERVRFSSAEQDGKKYLMLRYRPGLRKDADRGSGAPRPRRNWVILFESSGDRDAVLARGQVEVARALLNQVEHDDTFAVLTAGTSARAFRDRPVPATAENVRAAVAFLEQAHLAGALDLGQALDAAGPFLRAEAHSSLVHLGSGVAVLGELRRQALVERIPKGARYVGVGVGNRQDREFMKAAAERTGGYVSQINPNEPVAWRAFELWAALEAPRLLDVQVIDDAERAPFLTHTTSLAQGEELYAITRVGAAERLPESVTIAGVQDGRPFRRVVRVESVAGHADYLPRTWARLEIDRLLAAGADKNKDRIVELSKAMYVMSPFTSLLVLENEEMYRQYHVDGGRKDHWAMYPCPEKIPVVVEPLVAQPGPVAAPQDLLPEKPETSDILSTILVRVPPRFIVAPDEPAHAGRTHLTAGEIYRSPPAGSPGSPWIDPNTANQWLGNGSLPVLNWQFGNPFQATFGLPPWGMFGGMNVMGMVGGALGVAGGGLQGGAGFAGGGLMGMGGMSGGMLGMGGMGFGGGLPAAGSFSGLDYYPPASSLAVRGRSLARQVWAGQIGPQPGVMGGFPGNGMLGAAGGGLAGFTGGWPGNPGLGMSGMNGAFGPWNPGWLSLPQFNGLPGLLETVGTRAGEIRARLERPMDFEFDGTLQDAVSELGKRLDVTIRIDVEAFRYHVQNVASERVKLPPVHKVRAGRILTWLVEQVQGDYFIDGDYISVTTMDRKTAEEPSKNPLFPSVTPMPQFVSRRPAGNPAVWQGWELRAFPLADILPQSGAPGFAARPGRRWWEEAAEHRAGASDLSQEIDALLGRLQGFTRPRTLLHSRPEFGDDPRIFLDLLAYAPGMNTTPEDVLGVLDAEARQDPRAAPGRIDAGARKLIDRARSTGWQAVAIPDERGRPGFTVVFDGQGRYAYERVLPEGLRERVVCDGRTLLHLYPELGVGARRDLSRFHRAALARLVPWSLPPAEDLARGGDVKLAGADAVAIVPSRTPGDLPSGQEGKQVHLVFAPDGRLAERRLVDSSSRAVLRREVYDGAGGVRLLDADGKELAKQKLVLRKPSPPELRPETAQLVVLPLPFRTVEFVERGRQLGRLGPRGHEFAPDRLALVAAHLGQNDAGTLAVVRQHFYEHGDRRPGFSTLLAAARAVAPLDLDVVKTQPDSPLAHYFEVVGGRHGRIDGPDGLLRRLAEFHEVYRLVKAGVPAVAVPGVPQAEGLFAAVQAAARQRVVDYVRGCRSALFAWGVVDALLYDCPPPFQGDWDFQGRVLAESLHWLDAMPELGIAGRYEFVFATADENSKETHRKIVEVYLKAVEDGILPLLNPRCFQESSDAVPAVPKIIDRLAAEHRPGALLVLAWQCREMEDLVGAEAAFDSAFAAEPVPPDVTLAGVEYLWQTGELARADTLVQTLLKDPNLAEDPAVLRLAAALADRQGEWFRAASLQDRALQLKYRQAPEVVDLQTVRSDYGALLERYRQVAAAMTMDSTAEPAKTWQPRAFVAQVIGAADRWRTLDGDGTFACLAAARVFQTLGLESLAWEYATTPVAAAGGGAAAWEGLGWLLTQGGALPLADRAYAAAFAADPTDAQVLWDRALVLQQLGKREQARGLFRQITEGTWPAAFLGLKERARRQLNQHARSGK